jgi:LPXTG-motif cell wall-anchored protein
MLLAAMLALALVAPAPSVAQVSQEQSERNVRSGAATPKTEIASKGDQVNLCTALLQATNTGNVTNEQGTVQYKSDADDLDFEGSNITITPELTQECTQTIRQVVEAAPKGEAKAEGAEAKAGQAEAQVGGGGGAKELPKTGGVAGTASLLGLGAGTLLVAGGLLARRIIR